MTNIFDIASNLTGVLAIHPASRDPFSPGPREQLNPLLNILSLLRNGNHRFMPLLLSKAHEVLPKIISPMLQNVPESIAMNACNVDIFDGFGNGGMAQPAAMMDSYEKKYTPPDSNSSQGGGSTTGNDMHSPFAMSSPMSPAGELPNNNFNPMSDVMMNQMGQPAAAMSQVPTSNPPPPTPHLHQPPAPMSPMPTLNAHMQNGLHTPIEQSPNLGQNYGQPFNQAMSYMNGMGQTMHINGSNMGMPRQTANRASSFVVPPNPQLRTIGDFQALQRANSDISTMGSMNMSHGLPVGSEMNYGEMR